MVELMVATLAAASLAQWLPVDPRIEQSDPLASTYSGEVCAWYDVHRLLWRPRACANRVDLCENDAKRWPRLGEVFMRPAHLPNATVCDGYGVRRVRRPCGSCDGNDFAKPEWSVLQCASVALAPSAPPRGAASPALDVLLVASDHNNHGLFGQVERVLNQLHLAGSRGLTPFVFLGRKVVASPDSCNVGENQYYEPAAGDNVWEYYFEQVSAYRLGASSLHGRPVRLLFAAVEDTRRHAIAHSGDAVTSYFEFQRYDETLHTIRQRVRRVAAGLVQRWLRVRAPLRHAALALLRPWRQRSRHILGVHLRGTDKVTHPRIPLGIFFPKVDAYLAAHADGLVLLCTDDAADFATFAARYGGRLVSRGQGYTTRNVVRDPALPRRQKGEEALLDALLLAHTDFLLKGTSSLAEFALWYAPHLIERHLDLQLTGAALRSAAYTSRLPSWFGGPAVVPERAVAEVDAMMAALAAPAAGAPAAGAPASQGPRPGRHGRARGKRAGRGAGKSALRRRRHGRPARDGDAAVPTWPQGKGFLQGRAAEELARLGAAGGAAGPAGTAGGAVRPVAALGGYVTEQLRAVAKAADTVDISHGSCSTAASGRGRVMTQSECATYAEAAGLTFIGRSTEPAEYPGCTRWGTGHVEFNDHKDESRGCGLGKAGRCVCVVGVGAGAP